MSIRAAVYSLLSGVEGDVYPMVAPQEVTDPYVVYNMRMEYIRTQTGITVTDTNLTLNIYANTLSDTITLADTMSAALESASGTYATETLHICNWVAEDGFYIDELQKYAITQEYILRFT